MQVSKKKKKGEIFSSSSSSISISFPFFFFLPDFILFVKIVEKTTVRISR